AAERIRPQAVAPTLAVLEERGLVERRQDPADGRRQLVSLSPAGLALFEDSRNAGDEWLTRAMRDHYTEAERRTLLTAISLLDRLHQP
ncbi:MAG: winged helix DNA-binding protein, partial [Umezawaea sp.]